MYQSKQRSVRQIILVLIETCQVETVQRGLKWYINLLLSYSIQINIQLQINGLASIMSIAVTTSVIIFVVVHSTISGQVLRVIDFFLVLLDNGRVHAGWRLVAAMTMSGMWAGAWRATTALSAWEPDKLCWWETFFWVNSAVAYFPCLTLCS